MTVATSRDPILRYLSGSIVFALLWVAVSAARPTTTFHLAPAIVAIWPTLAGRELQRATFLSAIGFLVAATTTLALSAAGLLQGPTLLPWGGPAVESLVAAGVAGSLGLLATLARLRKVGTDHEHR